MPGAQFRIQERWLNLSGSGPDSCYRRLSVPSRNPARPSRSADGGVGDPSWDPHWRRAPSRIRVPAPSELLVWFPCDGGSAAERFRNPGQNRSVAFPVPNQEAWAHVTPSRNQAPPGQSRSGASCQREPSRNPEQSRDGSWRMKPRLWVGQVEQSRSSGSTEKV